MLLILFSITLAESELLIVPIVVVMVGGLLVLIGRRTGHDKE